MIERLQTRERTTPFTGARWMWWQGVRASGAASAPLCHLKRPHAFAQQAATASAPASNPVIEEWVYRTKHGYKDEWWTIFKKYQIAIVERQKELGYVKKFTVYAPSLHTSEDARWDYRVIIVRASADAPPGQSEGEISKQLFLDQTTFKREENRRRELTSNHWDLPIHVVSLDASN